MNKVIEIGRLTRDVEVRYGQNNTAVAGFTIAVDRRFKREGQPDADFFSCSAFGKTAEFAEKYLKKGVKVAIVGSLQNNHYKDKNGVDHYTTQIIVDEVEFAESKAASQQNNDTPKPSLSEELPQMAQTKHPVQATLSDFVNVPNDIMDDLPFARI